MENVLDILRSGIESALLGLGHASVNDLSPDDLIIPDGFGRHSAEQRSWPPMRGDQLSNFTTPRTMVPAAWSS